VSTVAEYLRSEFIFPCAAAILIPLTTEVADLTGTVK
jgi:hypothetical protein